MWIRFSFLTLAFTIVTSGSSSSDIRSLYIDLKLPSIKTPAPFTELLTGSFASGIEVAWSHGDAEHLKTDPAPKTPSFLSHAIGSTEDIYNGHEDSGLFGTVFKAWSNHWDLKTSPDDWWQPMLVKIATAINEKANDPPVRAFFVGGEGKETLTVEVPSFSIYDTDYQFVFDQFSKAINEKILVPDYVSTITSNFSTTVPAMRLASQITTMKSFQNYFDYKMGVCGCGIHGLEMLGTEKDWLDLQAKLRTLREILQPIERSLRLNSSFDVAQEVFENLHRTFVDGSSMSKWWADVLIQGKGIDYGPSGIRRMEVDAYNGWLVSFVFGWKGASLKAKDLASGKFRENLSGLTSCMIHIVDRIRNISDDSVVVAGILGYTVIKQSNSSLVTLQPVHGWSMLLHKSSPLRTQINSSNVVLETRGWDFI